SQSDNGTKFKNDLLKADTQKANVDHRFISPYHPRANGLSERLVQTAKQTVAKLIMGDSALMSEKELLECVDYMTKIVFPAVSEGVWARQKQEENRFTKSVVNNPFPDGSFVMTEDTSPSNALTPRWEGPYKVVRRNRGGAFTLEDSTKKQLPSNAAPSRMKMISRDPVINDNDVYEVEEILFRVPTKCST
ncbi:hypothetical protein BGZ65_011318, partial [Modicella reniformis]